MATISHKLAKLKPRQRAYLKLLAKGVSKEQAAITAGYAKSVARRGGIETPEMEMIFRELVRRKCPPGRLAKTISEGLDATHVEFAKTEGKITDRAETPDWGERRQYVQLAAQYSGYVQDDKPQSSLRIGIFTGRPSPMATCVKIPDGPALETAEDIAPQGDVAQT